MLRSFGCPVAVMPWLMLRSFGCCHVFMQEREASKKVFKAYFDKAKDKADEPLYDDPPSPPLTPEPSLAQGLGTRLQTLSAPLAHSSTLRWVLGAAAVTVAACWLLPHIR